MDEFNAYLIGVGGQGIGLLSEILIRAADHAATVAKHRLIPQVRALHYRWAMADLLTGEMLSNNMALFDAKNGGE